MAIECECPACYESMQLEDTAAGKMVRCGVCQHKFRAPGTPVESAEVEPPAKTAPPKIRKAESPAPKPPKGEPAERSRAEPPEDEPRASKPRKTESARRDRAAPRRRRSDPGNRLSARFWVLLAGAFALVLAGAGVGGYLTYTRVRQATEPSPEQAQQMAQEQEAARKRQEEAQQREQARRAAEEANRIEQQKRKEEADAKERAYLAELEKLRDAFRTPGRPAPDPYLIPGLVLHLGFDGPDPMWPKAAGRLEMPTGAVSGPGPRGSALYLPPNGRVVLRDVSNWLKAGLSESVTVSGWVKLRYRAVALAHADALIGQPIGHLTVGGRRVVLNTRGGREGGTDEMAALGGGRAAGSWQRDDFWHHVAAVRERGPAGERAVIYLDGKPVADTTVTPGNWSQALTWTFAQGLEPVSGMWSGPTGPPDHDGKPTQPGPTEIAYAVDEICLYERALTPAEVRTLAGVDPVPADIARRDRPADPTAAAITEVKLTEAHKFTHYPTGVVFDPGRATAWAVTGGMTPTSSHLIRLSYPEFKPIEWYLLEGASGPVALDTAENRLFVVLQDKGKLSGPQTDVRQGGWRLGYGSIHRYDLDGLPRGGDEKRPTAIKPAAVAPLPLENPATALAVTRDGKWVCVALPFKSDKGTSARVFRIPADLESSAEHLTGPGLGDTPFPYRLAVPAGSPAVWFSTAAGEGAWVAVDVATGKEVARPSFRLASAVGRDWAVHPAGDRMYLINDDGGVDEAKLVAAGQDGERRRPLVVGKWRPLANYGHLAATDDGRYVFFASPFNTGGDLTVVDTAARLLKPGAAPPPALTMRYFGGPFWLDPAGAVVVSSHKVGYRVSYPPGVAPVVHTPAPRPKQELAVAPPPRPLAYTRPVPPSPTEFPALKFHLAFDEDAGAGVKETVSGKVVGKLRDGQYIDGVRGKALRLASDPKMKQKAGLLDLSDQKEALRVPADTPFTFTMWVRPVEGRGGPFEAYRVADRNHHGLWVNSLLFPGGQGTSCTLGPYGTNADIRNHRWAGSRVDPGTWQHFAMVREGDGTVRVLIDGEEAKRNRGNGQFPDALEFTTISCYVPNAQAPITLDLDEICLFDQALTDEQIRRLAAAREPPEPRPPEPGAAPKAAPVRPADITRDAAPTRPYAGRPLPVATGLKGLTFYLPLTTLVAGKTPEAVSITDVAVAGAAQVDGVRGKALRFTPQADGAGVSLPGGALKAAAGKPFTLAAWVRVLNADRADNPVVLGVTGDGPQPTREFVLAMGKGTVELRLGDRTAQARPGVRIAGPCPEPGRWVHLAVTRDDGGRVRLLVDGAEVAPKGEPIFPHEIGYERVRLAVGPPRTPAMDLAEFALFDRALTDAEIRRLAGAK
jgi:hypothetical protein